MTIITPQLSLLSTVYAKDYTYPYWVIADHRYDIGKIVWSNEFEPELKSIYS